MVHQGKEGWVSRGTSAWMSRWTFEGMQMEKLGLTTKRGLWLPLLGMGPPDRWLALELGHQKCFRKKP